MKTLYPVVLLCSLFLLIMAATSGARAQAPAWQSAMSVNALTGLGKTVADANGNLYLAGGFTGTAIFGPFTLNSAGGEDVYVAKWNIPTNRFVWAQRAGGTGNDKAYSIALSGAGVYITGGFTSVPATFGSITLNNSGFLNTSDLFVAKLTDAGASASFTWAQQAGGMDLDWGHGIVVNGANVYVTGVFEGAGAVFGPTALSSNGSRDIFVTKLTDAGSSASFRWAHRMGSSSHEYLGEIVTNGSSVYVAGSVSGTLTFNNVPATGPFFNDSPGGNGAFVVKLTDAGPTSSYTWVQRANGQSFTNPIATALAVEGTSLYLGGYYFITGASGPSVVFGATTLGYPVSSNYYGDMFVAKLTDAGATGSFVWARQSQDQGSGQNQVRSLKASGTSLYVAGTFTNFTRAFGPTSLTSAGDYDVFVAKLSDAGTSVAPVWAQRAGGTGEEVAHGLSLSGTSVVVTGSAMAPANFGSFTLTHPLRGVSFGFMASLVDPTLTATTGPRTSAALELYPNPAHAAATVQFPATPGAAMATLTLLDALGRAMRTHTLALPATGLRHELNLTGLAPGIYAVQVQAGAATAVRRLVVE